MKKRQDQKTLRWIVGVAKKQIPQIVGLSLITCVMSGLSVSMALIMRNVVDSAVSGTRETVIHYGLWLVAVVLLQIFLRFGYQMLEERTRAKMEIGFKLKFLYSVLHKDYQKITAFHSGELLNRMTSDVGVITSGVISIVPNTLGLVTKLIFAVIALASMEKWFAVIFLGAGVCIFFVTRAFRKMLKAMHKNVQKTEDSVRAFHQEAIENILVVQVFGAAKQILRKANALLDVNYRSRMRKTAVSGSANTGLRLVFNGGYFFAFFWCIFRLVDKRMTYGTLTAVLELVNQIQNPVSGLSGIVPWYYSILASGERLLEIENIADEVEHGKKIQDPNRFYKNLESIEAQNVTFRYNRDVILDSSDMTVRKGDFVAITGISGIGKSTLLKIILGVLTPEEGTVQLNLSNGQEPVAVSKSTRPLFAYVPQGNMLLSGTILENITFLSRSKDEDDIDRAIEIACADEFISALPDGVNTLIGERGMGLSEGQVQRIAIARAILCDAPILLLDEATSALDEATEAKLLKNLQTLEHKTCVIISHKKAAIEACNVEMQIVDKRIVTKRKDENQ